MPNSGTGGGAARTIFAPGDLPRAGFRLVLLALFIVLVCCRMPDILLKQRLWAEEGLFYQNAWYMPPWQALWLEYGGYLNIVANAAGVIARWAVPMRDAPLVATGIGLAFQTLPAVLIVTSRASWLQRPAAMMLAVIAVAATPASEEVWLQTLHSQNHLALCAALILSFDDVPGPAVRWLRRVVLLLGPLTGMLAVLVLPLMLVRAVMERRRERWIQAGLLAVGAAIQIGLFYSPESGAALGRSSRVWPGILVYAFFIRHVAVPVIGALTAREIGDGLYTAFKAGVTPLWPVAIAAVAGSAVGVASLVRWRTGAPWLLAAGTLIAGASYAGAIGGGLMFLYPFAGERYSFVPEVLFVCTVIAIASGGRAGVRSGWLSWGAALVAIWMTGVGLVDYMRPAPRYGTGPAWRDEVARWEADPDYVIQLWPDGWWLQLTKDHSKPWLKVRPPELMIPVPHRDQLL